MKPISNHTGQYFRQIPKFPKFLPFLFPEIKQSHMENLLLLAPKNLSSRTEKFIVRDKNVNQWAMGKLGKTIL